MTKEKTEPTYVAKIAVIDGKEEKIIVAHTEYGMEQPKDRKNLIGSLDRSKILNCIFHLADPKVFWDADMQLMDENNKPIEKGTANVYVLCPTADSYWRVAVDEKLQDVRIHTFSSVQEYAQAIGCTNLYSRSLNSTEKMAVSALATGDDACMAVFKFSKKHKLSISTAQHYLDFSLSANAKMKMQMGKTLEKEPVLGRDVEDAEKLYEAANNKFGKIANKRYVIRPINTLLRNGEYSVQNMLDAINKVSESENDRITTTLSGEKESIITMFLTQYLFKEKEVADTKTQAAA